MRLPATGNPGKRRLAVRLGWLVALLALLMDRQTAFAQTKTWSGVVSALWSDPGNWIGGVAPVDGDSLSFGYASYSHAMWNDIPGLTLGSVYAAGDFSVGGETVTLTGDLAFYNWNVPTILGASVTMSALTVGNVIDLNGHSLTLSGSMSSAIVGSGAVTVSNFLQLQDTATASFTGSFTVSPGASLSVSGTISSSPLTVGSGGFLAGGGTVGSATLTNATLSGGEPFTTGDLHVQGGHIPFEIRLSPGQDGQTQIRTLGTVTLASPALEVSLPWNPPAIGTQFVLIDNDGTDAVAGTFAGLPEGAIFAVGDTSFRISYAGGTGNDVVLTTEAWNGPKRWLGVVSALWSVAGNWLDGAVPADGDSLFFPYYGSFSHAMWNDVPGLTLGSVTASAGQDFSLGGETVILTGDLDFPTWNVPTILGAPVTMTAAIGNVIDLNGHALTLGGGYLSGSIIGTGSVTVSNSVTLTASATSTFAGTFTVLPERQLWVDGTVAGSTVSVGADGTLTGGGTVPATTLTNALLVPGAVLTTGDLSVQGGRIFLEINLSPGQDNQTQIRTVGTVTLANPTLEILMRWNPPLPGNQFVLIDNDGSEPVSGTFAGLPEGAVFSVGDTSFRISYAGGTGNDVVLTAEALSGPKRWLGTVSALWSVPANWLDGVTPVDGSSVSFPYYGSFSHAMWNDVPGLTLGSVSSNGPDFSVGGETVTLTGNLDFAAWNVPTILGASLTMRGSIGNVIELNGHALTLDGTLYGPIQGTGSVTVANSLNMQGALSNFSGTFTVSPGGSLFVGGTITNSPLTVSGGMLSGGGTVPATTVTNGTLTGEVLTTGNLLVQGGHMLFEIRLSPGQDGHSQIRTLGTLTLVNPTLQVSLPWNLPAPGQAFVLIDNDGTDPVSGTFAGLPEGAVVTGAGFSGSVPFRITYAGGTGNDVVVIALDTTATTLVSSPNPANTGEAITLTATVFSPAGAPIGTVVFKEGSVVLGTAALDTDGHASITRTLAPGTHTIVATYAGGGAFGSSVSNPLTQIVNGAPGAAATIPTLGGTALFLLAIGLAAVGARLALR